MKTLVKKSKIFPNPISGIFFSKVLVIFPPMMLKFKLFWGVKEAKFFSLAVLVFSLPFYLLLSKNKQIKKICARFRLF